MLSLRQLLSHFATVLLRFMMMSHVVQRSCSFDPRQGGFARCGDPCRRGAAERRKHDAAARAFYFYVVFLYFSECTAVCRPRLRGSVTQFHQVEKVGFCLKPGSFENIPAKSHAEFRLCPKCLYEPMEPEE